MKTEKNHREDLAHFGYMLYQRGLVAGTSGNLSVRQGKDLVISTPTGVCKGSMGPDDMAVVNLNGEHVRGDREVSSEIGMHLAIYRKRPDIAAVVHAHPTVATAFAAAGLPLDEPLLAENILCLGRVPLAPYGTPGTPALAKSIEAFIPGHKAILLANHGAVTYDETLEQAYWKMETLEQVAHITLLTRLLGQQNFLGKEEVERLQKRAAGGRVPVQPESLAAVHGVAMNAPKFS